MRGLDDVRMPFDRDWRSAVLMEQCLRVYCREKGCYVNVGGCVVVETGNWLVGKMEGGRGCVHHHITSGATVNLIPAREERILNCRCQDQIWE